MVMALEGIRVIEVGYFIQVPLAAALLAEFGAEVIKIEEPLVGDPARGIVKYAGVPAMLAGGRNFLYEHHNPNKKSVTINLKTPEGKGIIYRLVAKSDVFMTNLREHAIEKLGLSYKSIAQYNERIIYALASSYGSRGPDKDRYAVDLTCQARGGRMTGKQEPGMPPIVDLSSSSDITGSTLLAYGIMLALLAREKHGFGQIVHTSLLAATIHLERVNITAALLTGKQLQNHNRENPVNPLSNIYKCRDGRWICLTMFYNPDKRWVDLCDALGRRDLAEDTRFANSAKREENSRQLVGILNQTFAAKTCEEWVKILGKRDLGFAPVNTAMDVCHDEQVIANDYIVDVNRLQSKPSKLIGPLIELGKTPGRIVGAAPELGQHTEEVLLDLAGYTWDEIAQFRERNIL